VGSSALRLEVQLTIGKDSVNSSFHRRKVLEADSCPTCAVVAIRVEALQGSWADDYGSQFTI